MMPVPSPSPVQYQSCPRRRIACTGFPQPGVAQTGGDTVVAPAQRDQQVPDRAWCWGPAVGQDRWPLCQCLREATSFRPASARLDHCLLQHRPVQAWLDAADQANDEADRVSDRIGGIPALLTSRDRFPLPAC